MVITPQIRNNAIKKLENKKYMMAIIIRIITAIHMAANNSPKQFIFSFVVTLFSFPFFSAGDSYYYLL